ncbi:Heavy metal efflux pump, CzcA family [Desulfamplus magnetovallimortis]|uniref:Heavy metal efflux pump, CzcA family n=1 Tax=Desulfamplus magnetovallimortis TaxID=1246637 RepID=A0A1W1HGG0_9BACT|nr:efflux RND transporter permease subunit [Desulfamplus magnetovallimortis]SLM31601.1 Heavy metal efflux pump, CzcA family [Desulfamplus magnetovallimortis]
MTLSQFSVKRPIFTTMITLIAILLGVVSLTRLRIDLLPEIEFPTVSIRTEYEGASPVVMEQLITRILEEIVATVPGVEQMTSESTEGSSRITVSFSWGIDIDTAALDLQSKIQDEINELPDDIVRPRIGKFDVNSFPVVLLGISSNLDPVELTQLIENQIRYRFARLNGVAQVDLWGGFNREVRVELDHERLKAMKISISQILQSIRNSNIDLPAGSIESGRYDITLRAPAQYTRLDQIRDTVIALPKGVPVTLGQIAHIKDTYEKPTRMVRINGERGIRVAIRKQADANTVEVAANIVTEIEKSNKAFPQIHIAPVINQGNFIERSITNVANSVLYGGGFAVIVLLIFLRNITSTIVISLAIPISVITTFALVYFSGFTLNLMTLGGLALGVGMMVDSSIVVLENINRRQVEYGESSVVAAVEGTQEVSGAIIASTITTLVIFLPVIFMKGVSGILFKELAYVIIFSLVCSLLVSLSLIPMLASKLIHIQVQNRESMGNTSHQEKALHKTFSQQTPQKISQQRDGWIGRATGNAEIFFNRLDTGYRNLIEWVLDHRMITIGITVLMVVSSLMLLPSIGSEFLPPSDEGEVRVSGQMEIGTRLDIVDQQTRMMEQIVYENVPEMVSAVAYARGGDRAEGEIRLSLTPSTQRIRSNSDIADDLRNKLVSAIPGMKIRTRAPQGQFILERILGGDEGITIDIRGFDLSILKLLAQKTEEAINAVPGITDIESSWEKGVPQAEIIVDRHKIESFGLSVQDVTEILKSIVAGSKTGEFRSEGNSYRIFVQLKDVEKRTLDEILDLTITTPSGDFIALRSVVSTKNSEGPSIINRKDQQRIITVKANVSGRDAGSVADDVQAILDRIPKPVGYDLSLAGNYEEQQKSSRELTISFFLAMVLVYMVLACQYESLKNPLIVMFSVPVAVVGVLLTLYLTNTTLNVQSYIGCIMLGGIVVNNAILLVDQAGELAGRGLMTIREAVAEAGRRRLRPILMTTFTTIFGLLPLALGIGEGADAQAPLARAVVGGLTGSTLISLLLIPAVYSLFHPEKTVL